MRVAVAKVGPAPVAVVRVALAPLAAVLAAVDAVVRRPSLAVAGALLLVCVPTGFAGGSAASPITAADLAAGGLIAAVAIRMLAGDRVTNRLGLLPFAFATTAFALATVTAVDTGASLRGFVRYTELFVLIPVAAAMALRDRRDVLLVAGALIAVTGFQGAVGVWQYATGTGASYGGAYVRAVGTFGADQVLALGALLGYGILVTLALGLAMRGHGRLALLVGAGLLTIPLALTLSRGAWIATAAAVLVMLVIHAWRIAALASVAVALAAGVTLLHGAGGATSSGTFDERLTSIVSSGSTPDRSVRDRYALWTAAVDIWADNPVLGVGLKDFARQRDSYAPMSLSAGSDVADRSSGFRREPLLSPHNQYLMVLAEQGTVGIAAFGGLLATLGFGAVLRRRGTARTPAAAPAAGPPLAVDARFLDLVAPGIMVWTLIDFGYGDIGAGPTGVVLAILLGLVARRMVLVPAASPTPAPHARARRAGACAAGGVTP